MGHRILKSRWPTKPFTITYTPFILKFNLACTIIFKFFKQQKNTHFFTSTYGNSTKNYISTRANSNTLSAKEEWQQFNWTENYYRRYTYCRKRANRVSVCSQFHTPFWWLYVCSMYYSKKKMRTDFHQNDNCSTFLQMCYAPDAQLH